MAGIFGFFDYTRPGKGIEKDEPQKPPFLRFWQLVGRKFWKLIQLNLLYIAFCLPIVTIGPATAGLTYVLRNMSNEQPVFLLSDFWDGFKNNLLQSFLYSVIVAAFTILMGFASRFYAANLDVSNWMYVPFMLSVLAIFLFILMAFYAMLMIVTVDLKLSNILKNSLILAIVCLKTNIFTFIFVAIILFLAYLFPLIGALLTIIILPAFIGFIICFNSFKGIKKYVIDPFVKISEETDGGETTDGEAQDPQDDEPENEE